MRLVQNGFELIAIGANNLQSICAALLHIANPRADFGRRTGPALLDVWINEDSRRDDLVRVAFGLPPL